AAHHAAGAVTAGAERLGHGARGAEEEERVASHVARDDDRLPEWAEVGGEGRVARTEGTGRALAVDADAAGAAPDDVLLELRDVVTDVVDEAEAEIGGSEAERLAEGPLGEPVHDLAVRPGEVRRPRHGAEVLPPLGRVERHAGELPVGDLDAVARHRAGRTRARPPTPSRARASASPRPA